MDILNPAQHIRIKLFKMSQHEFAEACRVTQSAVSRWERRGFVNLDSHPNVRLAAKEHNISWTNLWFLETPDGITANQWARMVPRRRRGCQPNVVIHDPLPEGVNQSDACGQF